MASTLSYERLCQVLRYDMATGEFRWLEKRGRMRPGDLAGAINSDGYLVIRIDYVLYYAHRLAWFFVTGRMPERDIDHENLDPSDNRIWNLREATDSQNQANQIVDKTNTSGRKGVSWNREKRRWEVRIQVNKKQQFLGYFHDLDAAGRAYAQAAESFFGTFARAA